MCAFRLFLSVDSSLGRLDYSLLPDQALMEMLIEGFHDDTKKRYQDKHGMYLDVCECSCVRFDEDESVIEIDINSRHVRGSLELRYAPPKVKVFAITSNFEGQLTGSVDLTQLPDGMEYLHLQNDNLSGEIDLTRLPEKMSTLYLNINQLTGEIDLTQLPDGMSCIKLNNNYLKGEIDLTRLPDGIRLLYLNDNNLSGEVDLTQLPDGMEFLALNSNQLTGELDLTQLPDGMSRLHLNSNKLTWSFVIKNLPQWMDIIDLRGKQFNAIAVVDSITRTTIKLEMSGVTSVVAENGKERDMKLFVE